MTFLRPHVEISDVRFGQFFYLLSTSPRVSCALTVFTHTPDPLPEGTMFQNYLLFFPQQTKSIFLVLLVYKKESALTEPNHTKIRITDDHCTFLQVSPPPSFLYLRFAFKGLVTKMKAHLWLDVCSWKQLPQAVPASYISFPLFL